MFSFDRSSLRRSMSNTHLINGFYREPNNSNTEQFYRHGPYYENPDKSPYLADGPRIYKSDRHSFFNGKVFTIRDVPKSVSYLISHLQKNYESYFQTTSLQTSECCWRSCLISASGSCTKDIRAALPQWQVCIIYNYITKQKNPSILEDQGTWMRPWV